MRRAFGCPSIQSLWFLILRSIFIILFLLLDMLDMLILFLLRHHAHHTHLPHLINLLFFPVAGTTLLVALPPILDVEWVGDTLLGSFSRSFWGWRARCLRRPGTLGRCGEKEKRPHFANNNSWWPSVRLIVCMMELYNPKILRSLKFMMLETAVCGLYKLAFAIVLEGLIVIVNSNIC